jgi:GNAT superfamily N-acetyltransferase/glutathione synthase/RimK-type ligase-like ATP-grasp enzyme
VGRTGAPDNIPEFIVSDAAAPDTYAAIFSALEASSQHLIGPMRPRLLVIPIHDDTGAVAGGLWGYTLFRWLHVQLLFVPEARRGKGIGATLMALAEAEARDRGCIGAQVTTFSFQAAPFYEKLGYTPFGQLHDYPPGHSLLHLHKLFAGTIGDRNQEPALDHARALAAKGEDETAKQAYFDVLRTDPTQFSALNEIGALAVASGHRSAARTAYAQAVRFHPGNPVGRVNLGNLLLEDGDVSGAREHYEAALAIDRNVPEAHQGLARVLTELGDPAAEAHWLKGFAGHAIVTKPYRGTGPAVPLLLLVAARGGNIPTRHWIDDRRFAVSAIYADYHDQARSLPPHALVVNAIGDADLCDHALACAETMLAGGTAPVINPPARARMTRRADNARRFARIDGVIAPEITVLSRAAMREGSLRFPLLLRAPGFHTGRHFAYVQNDDALARVAANLPGDELLAIQYLNARGRDGMARKYRVMFIGGRLYPLHLAISADWKVHYFTAAMAANAAHRDEESRFLNDMPAVLGSRAITALTAIGQTLGLDYAGVDFALSPGGSVLVFEANATMVIAPPGPEPIWDYRRRAAADALEAARRLLLDRAGGTSHP